MTKEKPSISDVYRRIVDKGDDNFAFETELTDDELLELIDENWFTDYIGEVEVRVQGKVKIIGRPRQEEEQ